LQFNLSHLTNDQIAKQVEMILGEENVEFDMASTELIARGAEGSMRDALSLLDQAIAYGGGALEESQVRAMMGTIDSADLNGLIQSLVDADPEALLNTVETIALQNPDFDALLAELLSLLQKIAIIQILPADSNNPVKDNQSLANLANTMNKEDVQLYYQIGMMGRKDLYLAPDTKSGFEMIMIRMLAFRPMDADEVVTKTQTLKPVTSIANTANTANTASKISTTTQHANPVTVEDVGDCTSPGHVTDVNNTESPSKKDTNDWKKIIDEMALVGLVKELAGNCVLISHTESRVELALAPSQEHLLHQNQKDRLEQAIKTRFGPDVKLAIVVEDSENETPSETSARLERERQKSAEESVNNDPTVKSLIDTFNASVDQDSIQPQ